MTRPAAPSNIIKAGTPAPGRPPNQGGGSGPPGGPVLAAATRRLRAFTIHLDSTGGAFVSALSHAYRLDADTQLADAVAAFTADLRLVLLSTGTLP